MDSTYNLNGGLKPTLKRFADLDGPDFYPTPDWATHALIDNERFEGRIWEPACGDGTMVRVLRDSGRPVDASDLFDRGYGEVGVDFLKSARSVENIVTNQLRSLRRLPHNNQDERYDPTLHMSHDQYLAFCMLSSAFDQLSRDPSSLCLFFVTESAEVGKSFLLSAIESRLKQRQLPYLKLTSTGIAAVNIEGQTIHSALSMTTSHLGTKSTSFVSSIF